MKQPNGGPKQRKILAPSAQKVQGKNLPGPASPGNCLVGNSRHNVASSARMAGQDASSVRDSQHQGGRKPGSEKGAMLKLLR